MVEAALELKLSGNQLSGYNKANFRLSVLQMDIIYHNLIMNTVEHWNIYFFFPDIKTKLVMKTSCDRNRNVVLVFGFVVALCVTLNLHWPPNSEAGDFFSLSKSINVLCVRLGVCVSPSELLIAMFHKCIPVHSLHSYVLPACKYVCISPCLSAFLEMHDSYPRVCFLDLRTDCLS